jgi:hypothetical protein
VSATVFNNGVEFIARFLAQEFNTDGKSRPHLGPLIRPLLWSTDFRVRGMCRCCEFACRRSTRRHLTVEWMTRSRPPPLALRPGLDDTSAATPSQRRTRCNQCRAASRWARQLLGRLRR